MGPMEDAALLWQILLVGSAVGNGVLIWKNLKGGAQGVTLENQPVRVAADPVYATKADLGALEDRLDRLEHDWSEKMRVQWKQTDIRLREIEKTQAEMARALGRIEGALLGNRGEN